MAANDITPSHEHYDLSFWHRLAHRKSFHDSKHREHVVVVRAHGLSIMSKRMAILAGDRILKEEATAIIQAVQPVVIASSNNAVGVNHRTNHKC